MGNEKIVFKMVELALSHAREIIGIADTTSDDVKQISQSIRRLYEEIKAKNERQ